MIRFRFAYLLAIPVMAMAPLHFEASRYQDKRCGAENTPVLATQGDKQYKVTRVVNVGQPTPLALWHWLAGFSSVMVPPIVVAIHAMAGMQGDEEEDDIPTTAASSEPIAPEIPAPDLLTDGDDEAVGAMEFPDPLADDFDNRLAAIPDPIAAPQPASAPDTTDWMAAIVAAAQNRAASPAPPIAPAEFTDPLDLDTELDDQPALV